MDRQYLDFELEISEGGEAGYTVAVVRSPAGEARTSVFFPFSDLELKNHLQALQIALLRSGGRRRRILTQEEEDVRAFGRGLFEMVMAGDVGNLYYESQREAAYAGKGLRVKLRIHPPELAVLPWEFLFDPRRDEYICLSSHTPLMRYPQVAQPPLPLRVAPPLRILGMVASPQELEALDVALEKQRVETALADLQVEGRVELTWLAGQSWRDLQRALRREKWHVFHFIGHGGFDPVRDEGLLMLADSPGRAAPLYATQLGRLLANHRALRLVLLNACEGARGSERDVFSSAAGTLVRRGLPAVVAMQYEITDRAAIEFTQAFYEAVADGLPVDSAVAEARVAVSLAVSNTLEWGTPVLTMRAPDGQIFALAEAPEPVVGQTQRPVQVQTEPLAALETEPRQDETAVQRKPVAFDWVTIPAGEFLMGSDKAKDGLADDDELPQHRLYLPAYRIARTPVTNIQYKAFVDATGHESPGHWQDGRIPEGKGNHPVVNVSWHDARAYCAWLSREMGEAIRLPSEAEWEKAARGTDGRIYPWGNEPPDETLCNFDRNVDDTTAVGRYQRGASPYGCLDMAGNVWEWTGSLWGSEWPKPDYGYPYDPEDGRENVDAPDSVRRVLRGGSFNLNRYGVRCAVRFGGSPGSRDGNFGFRVMSPGL